MGRKKIPNELLTEQQRKRRERNERHRSKNKLVIKNETSHLKLMSETFSKDVSIKESGLETQPESTKKTSFETPYEPILYTYNQPYFDVNADTYNKRLSQTETNEKKSLDDQRSFLFGVLNTYRKLDSEAFACHFPKALILLLTTCGLSTFLIKQITAIYASTGFEQPLLVACGAVAMAIGFAALHATKRSKISLLFCTLVLAYELFSVSTGTALTEKSALNEAIKSNPNTVLLRDQSSEARKNWEKHRTRYESKTDKMHQNDWYYKTYVSPASDKYQALQKQYANALSPKTTTKTDQIIQLKIMYRALFVVLIMFTTHALIAQMKQAFVFNKMNI